MLSAIAIAGVLVAAPPPALPAPALTLRAWRDAELLPISPGRASEPVAPPPCLGDVCQPRVAVPGFEPTYARPSRTELAAVYLERFRLEPFATVAWALVASGFRLDYAPPALEGPSRTPTRWGTAFVRLKFRIGPDNLPRIPSRRSRGGG